MDTALGGLPKATSHADSCAHHHRGSCTGSWWTSCSSSSSCPTGACNSRGRRQWRRRGEGEEEPATLCGVGGDQTPCPTTPPVTTTPDPWPGCAPCPCTKAPFANFPAMEVQAHQAQA